MRRWRYQDLDGVYEFSEQEILDTYYTYWQGQMRKAGKEHEISPESCIEDWIIVNWAEEVKD